MDLYRRLRRQPAQLADCKYGMRAALAQALLLLSSPAWALVEPVTLADCAGIPNDSERLACFDRLAAGSMARRDEAHAQAPVQQPAASAAPSAFKYSSEFNLADHWELGPENKRGIFTFRLHRPNYLIVNYNPRPNEAPYRPLRFLAPESEGLSHTELVFQLGFKMKLVENAMHGPADIWFGYTQNSFWQAGNEKASSPFRETNYQPELMAVMPVNFNVLGMQARFLNLGLVHQSNGQASALSRSWNRIYAQLGMERENLIVYARIWKRLNESRDEDQNPDITTFMGYGDLSGTYRWRGHEFSALARYNFGTGKGAAQLGWAFPVIDHLKGYLQVFTGYGQSLIDYNYYQRTIGFGVLVNY